MTKLLIFNCKFLINILYLTFTFSSLKHHVNAEGNKKYKITKTKK